MADNHHEMDGANSDQEADPIQFGYYYGEPVVRLQRDGRTVCLVEEFGFCDSKGVKWPVPSGAIVDGASIPKALWSLIGGPFEGKYRDASVIHDWYCSVRTRTWKDVHRVFYDAMRASGVSALRAKMMYAAVYFCGPGWSEIDIENTKLYRRTDPSIFAYSSHSIFDDEVSSAVEIDGKTASDVLNDDSPQEFLGQTKLHVRRLFEAISSQNPSLDEIDRALFLATDVFKIPDQVEGTHRILVDMTIEQEMADQDQN